MIARRRAPARNLPLLTTVFAAVGTLLQLVQTCLIVLDYLKR